MIRALTLSNLYPSSARPQHGLFVEHRMRRVAATGDVDVRVVAPVPWFPLRAKWFGEYGIHASVPRHETRHGIEVQHPRHLVIPKVGMRAAPTLLVRTLRRELRRIHDSGFAFDLIDAHYLYPDGVAAVRLGRELDKPVVLTARGSDVNLIPRVSAMACRAILEAVEESRAVICVSAALRDALIELGADAAKLEVIRNGVDREIFRPPGSEPTGTPRIVSVGNLTPGKGHQFVIDALEDLEHVELVIAGRGPTLDELQARARQRGVANRVRFAGAISQNELCALYGSASALVLASENEGLPNVVLESLACGTPVVATRTGGIPEAVDEPTGGILIDRRSGPEIASAVRSVLSSPPDRAAVRATVDGFDWDQTAGRVVEVFRRVLA